MVLLLRHFGLGLIVALVGLIVASTPFGRGWEEDLGLTWLFRLRGPVAPPDEVAVVSIDRESAVRLGLPENPRKWPRDLHGRLLDELADQGASVVAFDVMFQEARDPALDGAFAEAVRRAGNVILFEHLNKDLLPMTVGSAHNEGEIAIEQRIPPIQVLADAALGLAPFVLPRVPIKVSQVWLFKAEAGDAATLPVAALQAHRPESYDEILTLVRDLDPAAYEPFLRAPESSESRAPLNSKSLKLRRLFVTNPSLASRLLRQLGRAERSGSSPYRHTSAVIAAFGGPGSLHLNYYGPSHTITTASYHQVVTGESRRKLNLLGRAIFVGAAARMQPEQRDGFYTPFTQSSGLDIDGVEIAATAFANLLDGTAIRPFPPAWEAMLLVFWGTALGFGLRRFSGAWVPLGAGSAGAVYFGVIYFAFVNGNLWLPVFTPLVVQLVPAAFGAILLRYRGLQRERENIRHAFGMHLPLQVVDQLARGIDDLKAPTEHAYGICLATDAEQYTALSERLEPGTLKQFLNSYFEALFLPVRSRGGVVADVVGDAMLAIWATDRDRPELRQSACDAALDILESVEEFNRNSPPGRKLPTRLGLHCGNLVLGHVGAADHFEYRPVGDIVNTTSRIEGLGKHLGTRMLVSEEVVAGLDAVRVRPLGRFLLKGKTRPLAIAELIPRSARDSARWERLCDGFSRALAAFQGGDLNDALKYFEAIEHELGNDGPAAFYRQLCRRHLAEMPSADWTGVVELAEK